MITIGIPQRRPPLVRLTDPQLAIEMPHQARPPRKESRRLYAAILILRQRGFAVYRRGADHFLDGRQLTTRELLKISRTG